MSFSGEMKDFLAGFQAGAKMGGDIQDRKLRKEEAEFERKYKLDDFAFRKERAVADDTRADKRFALDTDQFNYRKTRDAKDDDWKGVDVGLRTRALDLQARGQQADDARGDRALDIQEKSSEATDKRGNRALDIRERDAKEKSDDTDARGLLPSTSAADPTFDDEFYLDDEDEVVQTQKHGGMVLHAEGGAAIPEEPLVEEPKVNRSGMGDLVKKAASISGEVLDELVGETADESGAISTSKKPIKDRLASVEPATPEAIKAMDEKIDPRGEIPNHVKGAARLVKAYDYFVGKGETDNAKKIAAEIIKNYQETSKTLGQLAVTALDQGNLQAASKLIAGAYESIPDGGEMKVNPTARGTIAYKIDREGYPAQFGEATAQQVYALAAGVADGSAFLERMENLVGEARATSESKAPGKGKKASYSAAVRDAANALRALNGVGKELDNFDPVALGIDTTTEEGQQQAEAERAKIEAKYREAQKRAEEARAFAELAEEKTGRKGGTALKDIKDELSIGSKTTPAIPTEGSTQSAPMKISSRAEYDKLASGTLFIDPEGNVRRKP